MLKGHRLEISGEVAQSLLKESDLKPVSTSTCCNSCDWYCICISIAISSYFPIDTRNFIRPRHSSRVLLFTRMRYQAIYCITYHHFARVHLSSHVLLLLIQTVDGVDFHLSPKSQSFGQTSRKACFLSPPQRLPSHPSPSHIHSCRHVDSFQFVSPTVGFYRSHHTRKICPDSIIHSIECPY